MKLESIEVPALNRFASDYINDQSSAQFFDYSFRDPDVYRKRSAHLDSRTFFRTELAECIRDYMEDFPQSDETVYSLEKLKDSRSTVVIGGQQAGLLTGPLYSIHKIISIIKLAREQEKQLGRPVVPVFWIAGEDHDFLEVNHVYTESGDAMKKISYPEMPADKRMVSDIEFDKEQMVQWVKKVFGQFGERRYTKDMLAFVLDSVRESRTVTDMFSHLVMELFKQDGLLIIDSAFPGLRKLEKPMFRKIIERQSDITMSVLSQQQKIAEAGYSQAISMEPNAANLFYYYNHERLLLEYDRREEVFIDKTGTVSFTCGELLVELEQFPERFSNNVVTRPIMQEWLFPTLAFIGGPGEISYWGELQAAFRLCGLNMPPLVPRLNITLLEASIEAELDNLGLAAGKVIQSGIRQELSAYWENAIEDGIGDLAAEAREWLTGQYEKIASRIDGLDKGMTVLARKNLEYHLHQIDFLERKTEQRIQDRHRVVLDRYERVERHLHPNGAVQERTWNIFHYLNSYGPGLIRGLLELDYTFDGRHFAVKI